MPRSKPAWNFEVVHPAGKITSPSRSAPLPARDPRRRQSRRHPVQRAGLSDSITTVLDLSLNAVENDHLYTTHAFPKGSTARNKLQSAMEDAAEADRATVEERIAAGQTPKKPRPNS